MLVHPWDASLYKTEWQSPRVSSVAAWIASSLGTPDAGSDDRGFRQPPARVDLELDAEERGWVGDDFVTVTISGARGPVNVTVSTSRGREGVHGMLAIERQTALSAHAPGRRLCLLAC
ncbi:hypothetical protein SAMN04487904_11435 [Actinopolyspora lacussalsi subsp. righensis]|uniref:Uncharacterized protein n=1 Tax=Actinopolyspora righensis TaxID=995060 RepID=A0A1I7C3K2_9ACTN|nr:hypothetical protein SAMN04487904_11435 [Actinopolyspora righensis]